MGQLKVLHVEDDTDDAFFLHRALTKAQPGCDVHRVSNGEDAVKVLSGFTDVALPDLILLDIKLPGMSGFEFLDWMRSQAQLRSIPVVVMSGSWLAEDRTRAAELGACGYLVKNSVYSDLVQKALSMAGLKPLEPGA
jgi:CheY-like chemotaxis protein